LRRISALILIIILALSIGAGVYIIWKPLPFQPMSTPANVKQTLINGNITVDGEYFIQFTVPSDAFDITVSGNFSVLGEGTIRVIVVNRNQLCQRIWFAY
jgi:hypothetical protein